MIRKSSFDPDKKKTIKIMSPNSAFNTYDLYAAGCDETVFRKEYSYLIC